MSLRDLERETIRLFLHDHNHLFTGARVLDYGCGLQPYRGMVESVGGTYYGYDDKRFPGSVYNGPDTVPPKAPFDVILCTQVIQYVEQPAGFLRLRRLDLKEGGYLLLTGPTNWPVVEETDLHRFTLSGVAKLLEQAGFRRGFSVMERAHVMFEGERWPIGWAAVASA